MCKQHSVVCSSIGNYGIQFRDHYRFCVLVRCYKVVSCEFIIVTLICIVHIDGMVKCERYCNRCEIDH